MNRNLEKFSYTLEEAELATGISRWTWRRMALKNLIQFARCGKRVVIPASELRRVVAAGAISGPVRESK
jgi:hypothetical protein